MLPEALLPADDGGRCGLELPLDRAKGRAFGWHQNHLGAKHVSGGQRTGLGDAAEVRMLLRVSKISPPVAMTVSMLPV
jgi:hypothetical protein